MLVRLGLLGCTYTRTVLLHARACGGMQGVTVTARDPMACLHDLFARRHGEPAQREECRSQEGGVGFHGNDSHNKPLVWALEPFWSTFPIHPFDRQLRLHGCVMDRGRTA